MTVSTVTTYASLLKTRYLNSELVANLTEADNVTLGLLPKNPGFSGDGMKIPIIYSNPQGVGGTALSTVAAAATNLKNSHFQLTVGEYGGVVNIGERVIRASKDNEGAFLANKTAETDGMFGQMADSLSFMLLSNGGQSIGKIESVSTNDLTLYDDADAVNFEVGMTIGGSATDGTSGTYYTGTTDVTAVNRETGVISVTSAAAINSGTGAAADDFLFRSGDFGQDSTIIHGFGSFIPSSSASMPNLFSLVRTPDTTRLGGCRVKTSSLTGKGIEERIQLLGAWMTGRYKAKMPDCVILHSEDWQKLAISLQARGQRPANDDNAKFGYQYLEVIAGGGRCKVYADRYAPIGTAWMIRKDTWTLWSMGPLFDTVNEDGNVLLRTTAASTTASVGSTFEFRGISFPALVTRAPGWNGRVPV